MRFQVQIFVPSTKLIAGSPTSEITKISPQYTWEIRRMRKIRKLKLTLNLIFVPRYFYTLHLYYVLLTYPKQCMVVVPHNFLLTFGRLVHVSMKKYILQTTYCNS
jgi:hypothetical protein